MSFSPTAFFSFQVRTQSSQCLPAALFAGEFEAGDLRVADFVLVVRVGLELRILCQRRD